MARVLIVQPTRQPTDSNLRDSPSIVSPTGGDPEAPPAYHDSPRAAPSAPAGRRGDANPLGPPQLPRNYAYQVPEGYDGLLFHRLAPWLSPYVYPVLCSACVESLVLCILVVCMTLAALFVLIPNVPPLLGSACTLGFYVPIIHRLFVLDVRMLSLLLRQFETWFLIVNGMAAVACVLAGNFSDPHLEMQTTALMACSFHIVFSDAFRLPPRTILISMASLAVALFVLCACNTFQVLPGVNYDKMVGGRVSLNSLMLGRLMTVSAFSVKFLFKLLRRPRHCVILFRPMSRRDLGDVSYIHQQAAKPFGSAIVRPLESTLEPVTDDVPLQAQTRPDHIARDNYAYSAAAGGYKGMLLHNISPKLAEWAYPIIASHKAEQVVNAFQGVGGLAALAVIFRPIPTRLSMLVVLHIVPYLHRLLLLDTIVLIQLAKQFDTWFLFLNWAVLLGTCSRQFQTNIWVFSFAIISTTTCSNALLLDAICLPPLVTFQTAAHYALLFTTIAVLNALKLIQSIDYSYKLMGRVNIGAFHVGRLLTLGLFFAAQAVGLWLRPDVYVVIRRPLARHETAVPMLSGTLRSMTVKLAVGGHRIAGA